MLNTKNAAKPETEERSKEIKSALQEDQEKICLWFFLIEREVLILCFYCIQVPFKHTNKCTIDLTHQGCFFKSI